MTQQEKIQYVKNKLQMGEYILLPNSIAIGPVYKIPYSGEIEKEGFEVAFLYVPRGSGVLEHCHEIDAERYRLITGELKINGKEFVENFCYKAMPPHQIDICSMDTIIETCKVGKEYLTDIRVTLTNQFFDYFVDHDIRTTFSKQKKR